MLTIAVKVQIDFVPSCPFAPLRLTSWISYRNSSMPLTLPSARAPPLLVHAFVDPAPHSPNSPNSPPLVHAFVDPAPHSPNSPKLVHAFVDPAPHSPNSPKLVHAFVDPAPHSPNSPNSPKPDLKPNCPLPCLVQRPTIH